MAVISLFNSRREPVVSKPLLTVLQQIRKGTYKEEVELLRMYYEQNRDSLFDQQKRGLLSLAVGGHFKLVRRKVELVSYSGYVFLEIPYLTLADRVLFRLMAREDQYVFACFKNTIGFGLVLMVKVDGEVEEHRRAFYQLKQYFKEAFGTDRIAANGEDYQALCLMSYDVDLYLNLEAKVFSVKR